MKRKIKWLAPLTAGVFAATIGLIAFTSLTTKTYAYQPLSSEVSNLSATQTNNVYGNSIILGTDHYTDVDMPYGFIDPEIVTAEGVYFNGFLFKNQDGTVYAYPVAQTEIKTLLLERRIGNSLINYNNINFNAYTACTDVIVRVNSGSLFDREISQLPVCKNVYQTGVGRLSATFTSPTVENIYLMSYYYYGKGQLTTTYFSQYLPNTAVKNVYYTSYNKDFLASAITEFNNGNYLNKSGEVIQAKEATNLKFDTRVFFPYKDFDPAGELFVGPGYYETITANDPSYLSEQIFYRSTSFDTRIVDFNTQVVNGSSITLSKTNERPVFNTLVATSTVDYTFDDMAGNELVVKNASSSFIPMYCNGFNNVRFVYDSKCKDLTVNSSGVSSNVKKFLIPNEYKEHFITLTNNTDYASLIEYYDQASYTPPKSSFRYNDKVYTVSCNKYPIDDLIAGMTAKNITSNEEDVDVALLNSGYTLREGVWSDLEPAASSIVDESEFINGYQGLGSIYYSSDKTIEEVLKIASNYILQNNGIRVDDTSSFTVDFMVEDNQLTTTIKMNNKIVSSTISRIHKVESKEYGEFIYLQNIGCTYGELLIDIDSVTTHNVNEIFEYAVGQTTNLTTFNKTTVTDFSITTPSSADLATTYVHSNGNTYKAVCEALSFDLDQIVSQSNNCTITFKKVISPDDDKEDAQSQYSVKTITKIYVPKSMSAHGIPSSINPNIIRYVDSVYDTSVCLHMTTSTNKHDGTNYDITMSGSLPDGAWYTHKIPVEVLQENFNVGFAVCEDGTVIVIKMVETPMTLDSLKTETQSFLTNKLNSNETITLAEGINLNITENYVGSKYGTKNLDIVVSGIGTLHESSATSPVDQTVLKKGYTAQSFIVFTKNYTPEQAAKAIADKILCYNGTPLTSNYKVKVTLYSKSFGFDFYNESNEKIYSVLSTYKVIDDTSVSFIAALSEYNTGTILSDTKTITVGEFMNDIMKDVVPLSEYNFNSNVVMSTAGPTNLTGTYQHSNSNYYKYDYTVKVLNVSNEIAASKVEVELASTETPGGTTGGNTGDNTEKPSKPTDDKDDSVIDTIKDKMENNKAFQASMYVLGTVLGVLLIAGIFLLVRKFYRWLKR